MSFSVAHSNAAGTAHIVASEVVLSPSPVDVDYPPRPIGSTEPTADGGLVQQQPAKDNRTRAWVWRGYPETMVTYQALWDLLESLRARHRIDYGAVTPYVWLKDTSTREMLYNDVIAAQTVTGGTSTTLTDSTAPFGATNSKTDYWVEIVADQDTDLRLGQRRKVISNSSTVLTTAAWGTTPLSSDTYSLHGWVERWFRVRVTGVTRKVRDGGGNVRYAETTFTFVVDDPNWNHLG